MTVDIVTIFPAMVQAPLAAGIVGRAIERGTLDVKVRDLRDFTTDRHRVVDDVPYGGGPGMVLKPEPIFGALAAIEAERDVGKWPAGEIDDRPSQPVVERCEGPAEPVYTTPLSQGPIERFSQCQGAIFSRVVIVHLQVAVALEIEIESGVKGECR